MGTSTVAKRARIPLAKPAFDDEMKEAALQALQNEHVVMGESVFRFEEEFARYCGTRFGVATGSGTAALILSQIATGVRGGEVITTPASFVASANSSIHAGATPKFADITLQTYTLDPSQVSKALSDKTRALLPVHLYGYPAAMQELSEIATKKGIAIIEDACQAHGASYNGKKLGSIGDAGCFSFYPSKNITVGGDGGMVVTNNEKIAESVTSLRDCGRIKGQKYLHNVLGFTERLNTVQAAIGRVQLKRLDKWNEMRRSIAAQYDDLLSDLDEVVTPPRPSATEKPVYHLYVIRCKRRDELRTWLQSSGVETGVHYQEPIHLQPLYREMYGYHGGEFPKTEEMCKQVLSIPIYPNLGLEDVRFISETVHGFYKLRE